MVIERFNVSTRISIGFGALILISLALAGFGVQQLGEIGAGSARGTIISGNGLRVLDATRGLEAMRRAETRARLDAADSAFKDAKDNEAMVRDQLTEARKRTIFSEQRREIFKAVLETLATHDAALDQFTQLIRTAEDRRGKMATEGAALVAAADLLVQTARGSENSNVVGAAANVESAVLLLRVANLTFQANQDKAGLPVFAAAREKAEAALRALGYVATDDLARLIDPVRVAQAAYVTDFSAFADARLAMAELYEQQMRPRIASMQQQLDGAAATLRTDVATTSATSAALISRSSWSQSILAGVSLLIGATLALVIGRGITRPLGAMTAAMTRLADGDRSVAIPALGNTDEIGAMARAVEVFKENAIARDTLEQTQIREQAARARRQEDIGQLVGFFGRSVGGVFTTLSETSAAMSRSSSALEAAASDTGSQTTVALGEVEQTAQTVQTVAAASQELSASIGEIGRQASESQRISTAAMEQSDEVVAKVAELREAAQQIGTVVELISSIAGQTNLLALNATIEAARAGEAGRGFAVVAVEVKSLAAQTGKATEQIGGQIGAIQAATVRAAEAIQGIAATVRQVNDIALAIAAAVVQQAAATQEIARSVELVSGNTSNVAESMARMRGAVSGSGETASEVRRTATTLSSESGTLSGEVTDFLAALKELGDGAHLLAYEMNAQATVVLGGATVTGRVTRMSPGTALFVGPLTASAGASLELRIDGFDQPIRARFVETTPTGVHLQLPLGHDHLSETARTLSRLGLRLAA